MGRKEPLKVHLRIEYKIFQSGNQVIAAEPAAKWLSRVERANKSKYQLFLTQGQSNLLFKLFQ